MDEHLNDDGSGYQCKTGYTFQWEIDHWGTKWDAYEIKGPRFLKKDTKRTGRIEFQTAWSCPDVWLETVSKCCPQLRFQVYWMDDLFPKSGNITFVNGKKTERELTLEDYFQFSDGSSNEENEEEEEEM